MPAPELPALLPLEFEGVGLALGAQAVLEDLSFTLSDGPVSVILGPNGAGKTLTLRLANGLLPPTRGRIEWRGGDERARAGSAMVFQRPVVMRRTVAANVDYALRVRGFERARRARRTVRVLEATGLAELAGRPARLLSVGQQQRVALARAWALEPQVLFLDEPAAALDPGACRALESAIRLIRSEGTKIVMTTHDLGQARRMADEVLFLHRGRLLEQSPAEAFFAEPRSVEARKFIEGELVP